MTEVISYANLSDHFAPFRPCLYFSWELTKKKKKDLRRLLFQCNYSTWSRDGKRGIEIIMWRLNFQYDWNHKYMLWSIHYWINTYSYLLILYLCPWNICCAVLLYYKKNMLVIPCCSERNISKNFSSMIF